MMNFVLDIASDAKNCDIPRVFLCFLIASTYFNYSEKFKKIDVKDFFMNLINKAL